MWNYKEIFCSQLRWRIWIHSTITSFLLILHQNGNSYILTEMKISINQIYFSSFYGRERSWNVTKSLNGKHLTHSWESKYSRDIFCSKWGVDSPPELLTSRHGTLSICSSLSLFCNWTYLFIFLNFNFFLCTLGCAKIYLRQGHSLNLAPPFCS